MRTFIPGQLTGSYFLQQLRTPQQMKLPFSLRLLILQRRTQIMSWEQEEWEMGLKMKKLPKRSPQTAALDKGMDRGWASELRTLKQPPHTHIHSVKLERILWLIASIFETFLLQCNEYYHKNFSDAFGNQFTSWSWCKAKENVLLCCYCSPLADYLL